MDRGKRCARVAAIACGATACALGLASVARAQADAEAPQSLVTLVAIGALAILPFLFMTTTSYVKISVVFSILRNALGTGQVPSGTVIAGLSAICEATGAIT